MRYQSITPMLGSSVVHRRTGRKFTVGQSTTVLQGKPVVLVSSEQPRGRSGYRTIEQVLRDYKLDSSGPKTG